MARLVDSSIISAFLAFLVGKKSGKEISPTNKKGTVFQPSLPYPGNPIPLLTVLVNSPC
jgi:hypothetical protein